MTKGPEGGRRARGLASPFPASAGPSPGTPVPAQTPPPQSWGNPPPRRSGDAAIAGTLPSRCSHEAGWGFSLLTPTGWRENICCRGQKAGEGTCSSSTFASPQSPLPSWRLSPLPSTSWLPPCTQAGWLHPPCPWGERGCGPPTPGCCVGGCWGAPSSPSTGK